MEINNKITISFTMIKFSSHFYNDLIIKSFDSTKHFNNVIF